MDVDVAVPSESNVTSFSLRLGSQVYDVRVFFPDGRVATATTTKLSFLKNDGGSSKLFPYLVGAEFDSPYSVVRAEAIPNTDPIRVNVLLLENQPTLPWYQVPPTISYKSADAFKSVGRVVSRGTTFGVTTKLTYCNGVLVAPNLVLTNYHCMETQEVCDTTAFIISSRKDAADYECKKLIVNVPLFDQALFELKEHVGESFAPSEVERRRYYFPRNTTVAVVSAFGNWDKGLLSGWKAEKDTAYVISDGCLVQGLYGYIADFSNKQIPELVQSDDSRLLTYRLSCEVQKGQSGSPVYSLDGRIVGTIWGRSEGDVSNQKTKAVEGLFTPLHPKILERIPLTR